MSAPSTIIYQVLTRLWGRGLFQSFDKASFDYFKSLGVTHIWYTGIIRHASGKDFVKGNPGCPYSISDYYDVNPYLAKDPGRRIDEFRNLVRRTHRAGLKVLIDFIPNHVSRDYCDERGGIARCGYFDYDWSDTDKIDYNAPGTWEKMRDILLYWLGMGVDGFRCDMIELVPRDFFHWVTAQIREQYPECMFIGEAYDRGNYRNFIEYAGFELLYDKSGIYDTLKSIVTEHTGAESISWNWQFLGDLQPHMLNFLENHDEVRLASHEFAGTPERGYSSLAVASLLNTAPFMLYFGQELGEDAYGEGNCRTSIFNWTTVNSFRSPNKSVLSRYRECLALSKRPAFAVGNIHDLGYCSSFDRSRYFAWLRYCEPSSSSAFTCDAISGSDGEAYLVVASFSETEEAVCVHIPGHLPLAPLSSSETAFPSCGDAQYLIRDDGFDVTVEVKPYDFTVLKLRLK